ncbi:MAG: 2Fe-2S iron-sulfur cluster binding domain-containing protein [Candidatus Aenigmarchaeota archaeon]|nr:2Fe-2S iron-sulfur cluster binding domain-containing protein [Candidatus Aenigmarchaeota archaeon]
MKEIKVKVFRSEAGFREYDVPYTERMRILDLLFYIQRNLEGSLAFRWNCREGICGSCAMRVNGRPVLACKEEVKGNEITVEPLKVFPVVKDLVTDRAEIYIKEKTLQLHFIGEKSGGFYKISEAEIKRASEFRKCIDCLICHDVCHANREKLDYTGPRNLVKVMAQQLHPRNTLDRVPLLEGAGVNFCNVTRCCQQVCPQEIHITTNGIIPLKEAFISEKGLIARLLGRNK